MLLVSVETLTKRLLFNNNNNNKSNNDNTNNNNNGCLKVIYLQREHMALSYTKSSEDIKLRKPTD